jgi:ADP-ribosylglycohydrolase
MLVEIAIGDAYGAAFEYAAPTADRPNDLSGYFQHPRHGIAPGCHTDDTQISLAVAEALLEHGVSATALPFTENLFAPSSGIRERAMPAAFGTS